MRGSHHFCSILSCVLAHELVDGDVGHVSDILRRTSRRHLLVIAVLVVVVIDVVGDVRVEDSDGAHHLGESVDEDDGVGLLLERVHVPRAEDVDVVDEDAGAAVVVQTHADVREQSVQRHRRRCRRLRTALILWLRWWWILRRCRRLVGGVLRSQQQGRRLDAEVDVWVRRGGEAAGVVAGLAGQRHARDVRDRERRVRLEDVRTEVLRHVDVAGEVRAVEVALLASHVIFIFSFRICFIIAFGAGAGECFIADVELRTVSLLLEHIVHDGGREEGQVMEAVAERGVLDEGRRSSRSRLAIRPDEAEVQLFARARVETGAAAAAAVVMDAVPAACRIAITIAITGSSRIRPNRFVRPGG